MNPESTATSLASPETEQSAATGRVLLEVRDVRAGYGRVPVLHGVSFQLAEGEALGIVGHNGMGKTTLLKTLMGLLPATGGHITLDGTEVTREPAHARSRAVRCRLPTTRRKQAARSTCSARPTTRR